LSSASGATIDEDNTEILDAEQTHTRDETDMNVDSIETDGDTKDRLHTKPNGDIEVKSLPGYRIPKTKRLVLNYI
jgi:hypothetical protein